MSYLYGCHLSYHEINFTFINLLYGVITKLQRNIKIKYICCLGPGYGKREIPENRTIVPLQCCKKILAAGVVSTINSLYH